MPVGYFGETLPDFVYSLRDAADYVSVIHSNILVSYPEIYDVPKPQRLCETTGGSCSPSCRLFSPGKTCIYAGVSMEYRSLVECLWLYQSKMLSHEQDWRLFYDCFHPRKRGESREGVFKAEFPNDVPALPDSAVRANAHATKNLKDDDPSKWTEQRVHAAIHGDEVQRRMAATDWDWQWYSSSLASGHKISSSTARNKVRLDKILYRVFKDDYETGGTYTFMKTDKDFIKVQTMYNQLKHMLDIRIEFE